MDRIRRLARKIVESTERKTLFDHVVDLGVEMTGAERGLLVLREGEKLQVAAARNVDQESLRGREARLSLTVAREAIQQENTLLVADARNQELFADSDSVFEMGLRSVLCVPVRVEQAVVAALYVDSRFIPNAFGMEDARAVETLADLLALWFWKEREAARRDEVQARLQQRERELEEAQARLEELDALATQSRAARRRADTGEHPGGFPPIIGESAAMNDVYGIIQRVLNNEITVLITGESGTGKELVARAIYEYGRRKQAPFVAINCSSIPANLIESELFGHLKGAFTGATRDKKGLFEVADGGTLFLDEVGDTPLEMQGKLLRALQYGEIQRLGATDTRRVDVRVIAATNRNLEQAVAQGSFREDLYYRLNIVSIEVPPLRRRKEDIPLLVQHFIKENSKQGFSQVQAISPQALVVLRKYPWPGNVRELETVIKSACLFAESQTLEPGDFEGLVRADTALIEPSDPTYYEGRTLAEIERDVILATLEKNGGNKKRTAQELGIDRRTLYNKLKRYGMG